MSRDSAADRRLGLGLCALAAVLWAISATVARLLIDDGASALELSEARAVVAAAAFWIIARRLNEPRREAGGRVAVVSLGIALAAVNLTYFMAIQRLPVAIAVVIQYTAPALVVAYELVVEGRRPTRAIVLALAGVLVGVALVSDTIGALGATQSLDTFGLVLAGASAFGFAAYNLLAAKSEPRFGSVRAHAIGFSVASLVWVIVQVPRGVPETLTTGRFLPGLAFVTLVGTVAAFGVYSAGIRRVGATSATITSTLEPVAVALFGFLLLDQSLRAVQILGSVLVLFAVASLRPREVVVPPPGSGSHASRRAGQDL